MAVLVIAVGFPLAYLISLTLLTVARPLFEADVFGRENYRSAHLPTGMGLLIVPSSALLVALYVLLEDRFRPTVETGRSGWEGLALGPGLIGLCAGFALLGLLDDLAGVGESGGFRGHVAALRRGRLTTGGVKLLGGPVMAICALGALQFPGQQDASGAVSLLRDAALICLMANLANLFDRAPGRTIKFGLVCFASLVAVSRRANLGAAGLVLGAAPGLLPGDLAEEFMLGDAGSNVIGATVGFALVVGTTPPWRWGLLVVALAGNAASEVVSFSRLIDAVAPLRWFDRLGSQHR